MWELLSLQNVHDVIVQFDRIKDFRWFQEIFLIDLNDSHNRFQSNFFGFSFFLPEKTDELLE